MFTFYFNVETADGLYSESTDAAGIKELAAEVKAQYPDQPIIVEVVLERNGEVFYQNNQTVSVRIEVLS